MMQHFKKHNDCKDSQAKMINTVSICFSGNNYGHLEFSAGAVSHTALACRTHSWCKLSRGGNKRREKDGESERKEESERHREEFQIPLAQFEENWWTAAFWAAWSPNCRAQPLLGCTVTLSCDVWGDEAPLCQILIQLKFDFVSACGSRTGNDQVRVGYLSIQKVIWGWSKFFTSNSLSPKKIFPPTWGLLFALLVQ